MDITRTALTLFLAVVTTLFLGVMFDMRSWPLPLSCAVAMLIAGTAAWLLNQVEVRAAVAARERRHRRELNAAAHNELLRQDGIE